MRIDTVVPVVSFSLFGIIYGMHAPPYRTAPKHYSLYDALMSNYIICRLGGLRLTPVLSLCLGIRPKRCLRLSHLWFCRDPKTVYRETQRAGSPMSEIEIARYAQCLYGRRVLYNLFWSPISFIQVEMPACDFHEELGTEDLRDVQTLVQRRR